MSASKRENKTHNRLEALSNALGRVAKSTIGQRGFAEVDIISRWDELAGKELAEVSLPRKIVFKTGKRYDGTLYVAVKGGGAALLLQHKEAELIENINSWFGYRAVSRLKIEQGSFFSQPKEEEKKLPEWEKEKVELAEADSIEDEDLKQVLLRLAKRVAAREKEKSKTSTDKKQN